MGNNRSGAARFRMVSLLLLLLGIAGPSPPAAAQSTGPGSAAGIGLQEVLESTLQSSFGIRRSASRVMLGEGRLQAARSAFDLIPTATGNVSHTDVPGQVAEKLDSSLEIGASRRLRSGLILSPSFSIEQSELDMPDSAATSSGTASIAVVAPLIRDRGGVASRAAELAAADDLDADRASLRHQREVSLVGAVRAYWSYLAVERQLEVLRDSEARAARLLDEMTELVNAEQRPRADLDQLNGNLAAKRIDRIAAEQRVVEARQVLGLVMGWPASRIYAMPPPSDPFPEAEQVELDGRALSRLTSLALLERADLEAARLAEAAARERVTGAENELGSSLDLTVSASYTGIDSGDGLGTFFGGLYSGIEGPSASVMLRWQRPLANDFARGTLLQQQAVATELELNRRELEILVVTEVQVAHEDLARQSMRVEDAVEAARYRRETVENEKAKNRLGVATLFDVILAEDNLTSALLAEVAAKQSYADALASLRFRTGTLEGPAPSEAPEASLLLELPEELR
ncbi:MAG: TolC family protein [Holophagales bacterium]|nr:TolC family protein [Holophagales bacterium]